MKGNNSFTPDQGFQRGYEQAKAMLGYMVRGGENNNNYERTPGIRRYPTAMYFCRRQAVHHVGSTDFCNTCLLYKLMELHEPLGTRLVESDKLL